MVKRKLKTNLFRLDKKSFSRRPRLFFLPAWGQFYKTWRRRVDDPFAQCILTGPCSAAPNYISIATEVCSLLLSVKWFFMTLDIICERKPCVCALCSVTVTTSPPWDCELRGSRASTAFALLVEIQVVHFESKLVVELVDLHPLHHHSLSLISDKGVGLICHGHRPHCPWLCWLALRTSSDGHRNSLWTTLRGDQLYVSSAKHLNS